MTRHWQERNPNVLFTIYAVLLFSVAVVLLYRAAQADGLVLHGTYGLLVALGAYVLAVFIILLGFSTPRSAHISLDRITQVGLT